MRRLLISLLLLAACKKNTVEAPAPARPAPTAGASAARPALDAFLAAVRNQDLQAMSMVWGDKNGSVRDGKVMSREDMEQRELVLMRCFKHDSFRVLGEAPAPDRERVLQVELTRGTKKHVTDFYAVKGPERWYIRSANMEPVKNLCSAK